MKDDSQSLAAEAFGRNLRKLRKDRKMTQEKLAEELGISTKHVGQVLHDRADDGQHREILRCRLR